MAGLLFEEPAPDPFEPAADAFAFDAATEDAEASFDDDAEPAASVAPAADAPDPPRPPDPAPEPLPPAPVEPPDDSRAALSAFSSLSTVLMSAVSRDCAAEAWESADEQVVAPPPLPPAPGAVVGGVVGGGWNEGVALGEAALDDVEVAQAVVAAAQGSLRRARVRVLLLLVREERRLKVLDLLIGAVPARRRRRGGRRLRGGRPRRRRGTGRRGARRGGGDGLAGLVLREGELGRGERGLSGHQLGLEVGRVERRHHLSGGHLLADRDVDGADGAGHVEGQVRLVDRGDRRHRVEGGDRGSGTDHRGPIGRARPPGEQDGHDRRREHRDDQRHPERRDEWEPPGLRRFDRHPGAVDRRFRRDPPGGERIARVGRQLARRVMHRS